MSLYRITTYLGDQKEIEEFDDEDELRSQVELYLDDIEEKRIKSFTVSWISEKAGPFKKPFWES